jgi:hypothetical protein
MTPGKNTPFNTIKWIFPLHHVTLSGLTLVFAIVNFLLAERHLRSDIFTKTTTSDTAQTGLTAALGIDR